MFLQIVDIGRHILNSKSSMLNKIRISETLLSYFTGAVYWSLLGLLYYKMAIWFCWPFYHNYSVAATLRPIPSCAIPTF